MDIRQTVEPKSDQQNFDDYTTGPKVVTVESVEVTGGDQPVEVHLVEFPGRPYKPAKSMRRVLIAVWGIDTDRWVGRQIELFGDPTVKFGKEAVGGIRIAKVSHISKAVTIPLTVTRGKRAPFVVHPLGDDPVTTHVDALRAAGSMDELVAAWGAAAKAGVTNRLEVVAVKDARKAELAALPQSDDPLSRTPEELAEDQAVQP